MVLTGQLPLATDHVASWCSPHSFKTRHIDVRRTGMRHIMFLWLGLTGEKSMANCHCNAYVPPAICARLYDRICWLCNFDSLWSVARFWSCYLVTNGVFWCHTSTSWAQIFIADFRPRVVLKAPSLCRAGEFTHFPRIWLSCADVWRKTEQSPRRAAHGGMVAAFHTDRRGPASEWIWRWKIALLWVAFPHRVNFISKLTLLIIVVLS